MNRTSLQLRWLLPLGLVAAGWAQGSAPPAPVPAPTAAGVKISLEQAILLALDHSPALAAARAQIPESQAEEVTAAIKPNPVLSWDMLYLPLFTPGNITAGYLNNSAEFDASVAFTHERGGKREARVEAAKDATAVTVSEVADSARGLAFNVAQQFVNALLARSSLDFAQQDSKSWQSTVDISEAQYRAGALAEVDLDAIRLQSLQFETTVSSARLSLRQALIALRQNVGLSVLPASFDVDGDLEYVPVHGGLADLQVLALKNRPDVLAARQGVTAAESQYKLAEANGKRDLTLTGEYSHLGGLNDAGALFSIEIPVFDRNQGEIARTAAAQTQAQDQAQQANEAALSDVATAFAAVEEGAAVVQLYDSGYRAQAKEALDIRQYSYSRGASSLLDLLDAERTYRQTELGYRQALGAYMLAVEQLKEAVGTRNLP